MLNKVRMLHNDFHMDHKFFTEMKEEEKGKWKKGMRENGGNGRKEG